jgi:hypothetical protein
VEVNLYQIWTLEQGFDTWYHRVDDKVTIFGDVEKLLKTMMETASQVEQLERHDHHHHCYHQLIIHNSVEPTQNR